MCAAVCVTMLLSTMLAHIGIYYLGCLIFKLPHTVLFLFWPNSHVNGCMPFLKHAIWNIRSDYVTHYIKCRVYIRPGSDFHLLLRFAISKKSKVFNLRFSCIRKFMLCIVRKKKLKIRCLKYVCIQGVQEVSRRR